MPELPEVETVRRGLCGLVLGSVIESVVVLGQRSVRRRPSDVFRKALTERRIKSVSRRGKYLYCALDNESALVIHLRMSGRLFYVEDRSVPHDPHTHIVLELCDRGELRFVDPRTFGEMFVSSTLINGVPNELSSLGVDPLTDVIDGARIEELLSRRRTSLKAFFLDQHVVCGVGNLYADEICFFAGFRPDRRTDTLSSGECVALAGALNAVLTEAVECRGSSLSDVSYKDLFGAPGSYQDHHRVYGREGLSCPRCEKLVVRSRLSGRSAYYCENCQH